MSFVSNPTWLVLGALAGYVLMMKTNPVRECLHDGWLAVKRYPALWTVFGVIGSVNALFALGARAYLMSMLPPEEGPAFVWMRAAWRDPQLWLSGSPESLWWLPHHEWVRAAQLSAVPAVETLAGLFDSLVSTFPLSALVAPLMLLAWRGRANVLLQALRRRFGGWGVAIYGALALSALAAMAKPLAYFGPRVMPLETWLRWGQVIVGAAFAFEYLLGVAVQIFLLLLAYAWVRGLNFQASDLIDVAIRRFTCVLQWSALVLLLGVVLIELPLILKNFPAFATWVSERDLFARQLALARTTISVFILVGAGVQVGLALHASSWRRAWRDHFDMATRAWWPLSWFLLIALLHFFGVRAMQENVSRGVGEGTALWVLWQLVSPWLLAVVGGWLLASWVCLVRRFGRGGNDSPILT